MSWDQVCLSHYIDAGKMDVQTGPFGTQLRASDYTPEGTPVINVRNVGYGDLREEKLEFVPDDVVQRLSKHLLQEGDIVFGRKGAVDRHLLVKPDHSGWMQGSDCIRLRILSDDVLPDFLSFAMRINNHKGWMITQCSNKATMASLNQDVISRISVRIPEPRIQKDIVAILSAYDDLIENNRRRIQLLEESARLLYREWFVRLRFPGHEHVKVVDGVPEGWEKKHISEVCETVGGGTPKTKVPEYWGDEITWVVPTDVTRNNCLYLMSSARMITEKGLKESSAKIVPPYTILMTSRASVGFFALMDHDVCTNQGFINIIPKRFEQKMYYLFNLMSRVEEIRGNAKGTTYPEISKGRFRSMEIVIPSRAIIVEFCTYAENIFKQICCLKKQIEKTTRARDLLLPRLIDPATNLCTRS